MLCFLWFLEGNIITIGRWICLKRNYLAKNKNVIQITLILFVKTIFMFVLLNITKNLAKAI